MKRKAGLRPAAWAARSSTRARNRRGSFSGQRRVRKLPNGCCDTPSLTMVGVVSFDEIETWRGRLDRFDWKLVGKKERFIPYNGNRALQPNTDAEMLSAHHDNPDRMRWELRRVWLVEATLWQGQRHQAPKSRYYCDEGSWICVLGDRWDAQAQLWKTIYANTFVAPEPPGLVLNGFGFNDLLSGSAFVGCLLNSKQAQYIIKPRYDEGDIHARRHSGRGRRVTRIARRPARTETGEY